MVVKKYPTLLFKDRIKDIENELEDLIDEVLDSNKMAISLIEKYDKDNAETVIENSKEIDVKGFDFERKCIRFIATEQPVASDLMLIESIIRIISHLKRIGYLSANIAESSKHLVDADLPQRLLNDLYYMADYVQVMLSKGLKSFLNQDSKAPDKLYKEDDKIDDLFDSILKQSTELISKKTDSPLAIVHVMFISRFLERMADRVVSISLRTLFIKTNKRPDIERLKKEL